MAEDNDELSDETVCEEIQTHKQTLHLLRKRRAELLQAKEDWEKEHPGKHNTLVLTPQSTAKILGISTKTLKENREKNAEPGFHQEGRKIRYPVDGVIAFLERQIYFELAYYQELQHTEEIDDLLDKNKI